MGDLSFLDWPWAQRDRKKQSRVWHQSWLGGKCKIYCWHVQLARCCCTWEKWVRQARKIRGATNCQFPSWCSLLLITPAFPLNHLAMCALGYVRTDPAFNQWFPCMAFGRFISSLMCSPSSWEGQSQPSLLLSLCCCPFLVIEPSLMPVLGGLTSPPSHHYLMPLHFCLTWTVVC